jgi:hypothetical protein
VVIAISDFYVNDMMSGAQTIDEAIHLKVELLQLMARGQLSDRKWCSSSPALKKTLPEGLRETKTLLSIDGEQSVKAPEIDGTPRVTYKNSFYTSLNLNNNENSQEGSSSLR